MGRSGHAAWAKTDVPASDKAARALRGKAGNCAMDNFLENRKMPQADKCRAGDEEHPLMRATTMKSRVSKARATLQ
jgi:hypothetical protein